MGRGGRGQMAGQMFGTTGGMLSGIVSGVIWGAVVGGLVLLLAALVLDLDDDAVGPDPDAAGGDDRAVTVDAIGAAPVLLQGLFALRPPEPAGVMPRAMPDPRRSLEPRPAQPVLPHLVAGASVPVMHADIPPVPSAPKGIARMTLPDIPGLPDSGSAPRAIPPLAAPTVRAVPAGPSVVALAQAPPPTPAAPEPLITAPRLPRVGAPPGIVPSPVIPPGPADAAPVRGTAARLGGVTAPAGPPGPPARPAAGLQVAFVLDGETDAPVPDWLRARAVPGDGAALRLDDGAMVFVGSDGVAGYLAARATGSPALLVYARLDAADDVALERIALRARRDGAVAVLVAPDVALWDRIAAWLDGPARDLVPVAAGSLVE